MWYIAAQAEQSAAAGGAVNRRQTVALGLVIAAIDRETWN
jgi:hypothetical protein